MNESDDDVEMICDNVVVGTEENVRMEKVDCPPSKTLIQSPSIL